MVEEEAHERDKARVDGACQRVATVCVGVRRADGGEGVEVLEERQRVVAGRPSRAPRGETAEQAAREIREVSAQGWVAGMGLGVAAECVEYVCRAEGISEGPGDDVGSVRARACEDAGENVLGVEGGRGGLEYLMDMSGYVWECWGQGV
jgi:hypothetical protein